MSTEPHSPSAAPRRVIRMPGEVRFARPRDSRDVDDLRLAFTVLTTMWSRAPERRLRASDLIAVHRAFGLRRLRACPRLTLGRAELLEGGRRCSATGSVARRDP